MLLRDFRQFDPEEYARLEASMWVAYYHHNFIALFRYLYKLNYLLFDPSRRLAFMGAYHTTRAAAVFRLTKGHENKEKTMKHLILFFKLMSDHSGRPFDYHKAAKLEYKWWMVDRYPSRYKITRATSIAEAMAIIVDVKVEALQAYGQNRAAAMELLGSYHHDTSVEVDWQRVSKYLKIAFRSLYDAIQ